MRGTLWSLVVGGVGTALFLWVALGAATPASPASSTSAAESILAQTAPFAGLVLLLAGIGAMLVYAFRLT
jgi:hypothetical protein